MRVATQTQNSIVCLSCSNPRLKLRNKTKRVQQTELKVYVSFYTGWRECKRNTEFRVSTLLFRINAGEENSAETG